MSSGLDEAILAATSLILLEVFRRAKQPMTFDHLLRKCDGIDPETLATALESLIEQGHVRRREWGGVERFELAV